MSYFLKDLMIKKLKDISYEELQYYSEQYGFSISKNEASEIIFYLRHYPIDPFHADGRIKMFRELARITNDETAKKAQKLFNEMIRSFGVEHLFN